MKVVLMTGTHRRHFHLAQRLREWGVLEGLVVQDRGPEVPTLRGSSNSEVNNLFEQHFRGRRESERRFFGEVGEFRHLSDKYLYVEDDGDLNSAGTRQFLEEIAPDLLLTYNVGILRPEIVGSPGVKYAWNVHPGLTPRYKGAATHFWASYMLEPQMTGVTLHELTDCIDGGDVIHQCAAPLVAGDGIHDLSCRTLKRFFGELELLLGNVAAKGNVEVERQRSNGCVWRRSDWRPEHLSHIYVTWQNSIVDCYLAGSIRGNAPTCFRGNWME